MKTALFAALSAITLTGACYGEEEPASRKVIPIKAEPTFVGQGNSPSFATRFDAIPSHLSFEERKTLIDERYREERQRILSQTKLKLAALATQHALALKYGQGR